MERALQGRLPFVLQIWRGERKDGMRENEGKRRRGKGWGGGMGKKGELFQVRERW